MGDDAGVADGFLGPGELDFHFFSPFLLRRPLHRLGRVGELEGGGQALELRGQRRALFVVLRRRRGREGDLVGQRVPGDAEQAPARRNFQLAVLVHLDAAEQVQARLGAGGGDVEQAPSLYVFGVAVKHSDVVIKGLPVAAGPVDGRDPAHALSPFLFATAKIAQPRSTRGRQLALCRMGWGREGQSDKPSSRPSCCCAASG